VGIKAGRGQIKLPSVVLSFFTLLVLLLAGLNPASAYAGTAEEINSLPTLDAFNRSENPLSNSGKWSALAWASSTLGSTTGRDATTGWAPYDAWPTINGAYWNAGTFSDSPGDAAAVTMVTGPGNAERHVALWLDMSSPGSAKTGYQLRWVVVSGSTYAVTLSKWSAGTETVLASSASVSIPAGSTLAISDTGATVSAWQGTGGSLTSLLSASDSSYGSGYAGIEGSGNISRSANFKAGALIPPPDTTISGGPKGTVVPNVLFAFSGSGSPTGFECALDGGAYSACTSPSPYAGLSEGSHTFRVRALNGGGPDPSPAERSFQVIEAAKAVGKVAILDNFERSEVPLATGKFTKDQWAAAIGGAWMGSYRGFGSSSGLAGAYWNPGTFSDGEGTVLVSGVVGTGATASGQYLALWLDMPEPGTARSGYEARFTGNGTTYSVELSKWAAGTRTVLASTTGFALPVGTTMALSETAGGRITLWTGTTSLTAVLSANDSTYSSGYAGLDVNGGAGTVYNFRAGRIDLQAPDTSITTGPTGAVLPSEVSFGFSSTEAGSTFECLLDGGSYAACTSPKAYPGLAGGAHTFKVRASDNVGNQDPSAAERSFEVIPPPAVSTAAASAVKATQATLGASVNPKGSATTYQFEYGTTTSYGSKAPATAKSAGSGSASVEVSEPISGLTAGTTYHFRVVATNGAGTSKGEDKTFITTAAPVASTEAASGVEAAKATLNASVNPKGAATTYQFEYGPTTSYGTKVPASAKAVGSGSSAVAVSETPTLTEGASYHYRVVASNEVGTTYGADMTLTTLVLPDATTEAATAVEGEEATLNGEVDPNGSETQYYFQYGKTAAYGSQAPLEGEGAGSGESGVEVEAAPNLEPETTYHYRVVAASPAGTDFGQDMVTTTATASAAGGDNNGEFVNLMWSGDWNKEGDPAHLRVVRKSGAKMLRLGLFEGHQGSGWSTYNAIFCNAAKEGITIAPSLYTSGIPRQEPALGNFKTFTYEAVKKYGPGGSLWNECSASKPAKYWEVFNEENWGENVGGTVAPHVFGEFFEETSGVINNAAPASSNPQVILGGLLSVAKPKNAQEEKVRLTPAEFLERMNMAHPNLVDAVAVHPYAFAVKTTNQTTGKIETHAPRNHNQVLDLVEKVKLNIKEVHEVLPGTPLWINEIGWPTGFEDGSHLAVSEPIQAELIHESIKMMEEKSGSLHIHNVFYYNDWDDPTQAGNWAYHCGLQKANGEFRPAFHAFAVEAKGDQGYPRKTRNKTKGAHASAFASNVSGWVDPEELSSWYRFEYGKTTAYGSATANFPAGFEAGEKEFTQVVTGLTPNTIYHYRIVSYNENGEVTYGADETLKTGPPITANIRTLNGEYGWLNVSGLVESVGAPINGTYVNINLKKKEGGEYKFNAGASTHANIVNGEYSLVNWPVGKGDWQVNVVFPGQGGTPAAETGLESFTIKNAYHLVALNSGKCLEVSYGSSENGMSIHQEPCGDGHTQQAQAFTLVPSPYNPAQYELVNRKSGKCLDVTNVSTADGAQIQQFTCQSWGQTNQVFAGVPWSPTDSSHVKYIAQHSNKCLDITGGSTADGALLQQWTCTGATNQAFGFESVEADPVPTNTYITLDETLYGHPGYETFHGTVEAPQAIAGQKVYINFKKWNGAQYVYTSQAEATLNAAGQYSWSYFGVGSGDWEAIAIYPGSGNMAESRSPEGAHTFHVGDGYRFKFRNSNKCLSTSGGGTGNGTAILQWDCSGAPNPADGQVYSVVPVAPVGSSEFQIRPDSNTNMCLDVTSASTANGANLQLYQCLGEGQSNQIWHIVPIAGQAPYFGSIARHSNKCMDVTGQSTANGARIDQWECWWGGNQQWLWQPIG
jgi:hypothetical protein